MDDLDNFFGDEAADAFVKGLDLHMDTDGMNFMNPDNMNTEGREAQEEFIQALIENDELILSSLFGDNFEEDISKGKLQNFDHPKTAEIIFKSSLAGQFYPRDNELIKGYLENQHGKQDSFNHKDIMEIARQMIILNRSGKQ